jgi:triosephosphate isomerase
MKKPLFLGFNWKLNPNTLEQTQELLEHYTKLNINSGLEICVFPPTIYLHQVSEISVINSSLNFGSQAISSFQNGSYTAELSSVSVKDLGANYTLVGHSETRKLQDLNDQEINQKVVASIKNKLTPVLCIGYQLDDKQTDINFEELQQQLQVGLQGTKEFLKSNLDAKIIVAYEPVWAIGSGKSATKEQITEVLEFIKKMLNDLYEKDLAAKFILIYGGSVDETNCGDLIEIPNLSGFLVGGASLKPQKLAKIVNIMNTKV